MSEIPDDIRESAEFVVNKFAAMFPFGEWSSDQVGAVSMISMNDERNRCISILKSVEPMNPSEAHLIETIVRRIRGAA